MKALALLLLPVAVAAQPVEIPAEIVEQCKRDGCVIIMPEGTVIPKEVINQAILEAQQNAFNEGAKRGVASCKRRDV